MNKPCEMHGGLKRKAFKIDYLIVQNINRCIMYFH